MFYETYQKAPYWDGKNFNLDCDPPITITNEMLEVAAIFYHNDEQKQIAESSKQELQDSGKFKKEIVVPILAAETLYEAEEAQQY